MNRFYSGSDDVLDAKFSVFPYYVCVRVGGGGSGGNGREEMSVPAVNFVKIKKKTSNVNIETFNALQSTILKFTKFELFLREEEFQILT